MNPTLEAALKYAANGLAVFPVKGKIPATAHGFKDATTDETQIRLWWDLGDGVEVPGIAIATGNEYVSSTAPCERRWGASIARYEVALSPAAAGLMVSVLGTLRLGMHTTGSAAVVSRSASVTVTDPPCPGPTDTSDSRMTSPYPRHTTITIY